MNGWFEKFDLIYVEFLIWYDVWVECCDDKWC